MFDPFLNQTLIINLGNQDKDVALGKARPGVSVELPWGQGGSRYPAKSRIGCGAPQSE